MVVCFMFEVVSAFEVLQDAEWLVIVAGLSRLSCLNHHSPPVGRAISVCRRKRRRSQFAVGFPIPCGAFAGIAF